MKILVTGANGQLGSELKEISGKYQQFEFSFTDITDLDVTNESDVNAFFNINKPEIIINCSAYTAVDRAESEKEAAFLLNSGAVEILSKASSRNNSLIVHISTDYVFDGKANYPYSETSHPNPLSYYGKSKYAGEEAILNHSDKALIIRTSWLYSEFGNNFVKTIRKLAQKNDTLNVVSDQIGTPTYARDLADSILQILSENVPGRGVQIFHYTNEGVASWYDFANAIVEYSHINCKIQPIATKDYSQIAIRPYYSVLDKSKIKKTFSLEIPYWRESLKECISKLKE